MSMTFQLITSFIDENLINAHFRKEEPDKDPHKAPPDVPPPREEPTFPERTPDEVPPVTEPPREM